MNGRGLKGIWDKTGPCGWFRVGNDGKGTVVLIIACLGFRVLALIIVCLGS